jgi:hypothetical protein
VAHNQGQPSVGGVTRNTKLKKRKATQEPEQRLSAALSTRKSKDKTENFQSLNKEDSDKDEPKKQNRNKTKKSLDVTQEHAHALLGKKIEDIAKRSEIIAIETNEKKEPLNQEVCCLGSDKEEQGVLQDKTGSEISRSKKRRIRKRRLLESLGISIINPIKSAKEISVTKKRQKKRKSDCDAVKAVNLEETSRSELISCDAAINDLERIAIGERLHQVCTVLKLLTGEVPGRREEVSFDIVGKKGAQKRKCEDIVTEESYHTAVKSVNLEVTNREEETNCGIVGQKRAVRNCEDTVVEESDCANVKPASGKGETAGYDIKGNKQTVSSFEDTVSVVPKLEDSHPTRPSEQVTEVEESQLEKNILKDTFLEVKEGNSSLNSSTAVKVWSSCGESQCSRELSLGCKVASEDILHQFLNKKEEPSTSGKVDLASFLYHDNIEALFRSAVLNDVTLSSRCSEKEVKNFFNTYGTFSERGRTQFAAVEKLLHSNSKGGEEHCEPALNKDIPPDVTAHNSVTISDKEPDLDSSTSALTSVGSPRRDHFALRDIKDNVGADGLGTATCAQILENCCPYNQVVKGLTDTDSEENNLAFRGGFSRGPIYTSPNPENRVTNSSRIQNSTHTVVVPDTYESCDFPSVQKLDSDPAHSENDLSVKGQFTSGDKKELPEVRNVSEQSLACSASPRLKDWYREQSLDKAKSAEVNSEECQVNHVRKNGVVIECRAAEGEPVESHPCAHAECSKEQKHIPIVLNNICNDKEKEDSENCSEKVPRNGNVEKYRWTGFVSECTEDIQETKFEASKTVIGTSSRTVEEGQGTDRSYHISPTEISYPGTRNESSTDFQADSGSKEQVTVPNCTVTEVSVSESIKLMPIPSSEDKVIMNRPQRKPMENKITRPEMSREEVLAAREAKKAEKLARNKNKVTLSANVSSPENVVVSKSQSIPSPSRSKQPELTTEAGKQTEYVAVVESVSKNAMQCPGVKQLRGPLRDASYQKSKTENKSPTKRTELKTKKDEVQEPENRVSTNSSRENEASRTTDDLGEKVKDTGHGPQSSAVLPAPKSKAELRAERRAKQLYIIQKYERSLRFIDYRDLGFA